MVSDPLLNLSVVSDSTVSVSVKNSHFSKPRMTLPAPNTYYGSSFCEQVPAVMMSSQEMKKVSNKSIKAGGAQMMTGFNTGNH